MLRRLFFQTIFVITASGVCLCQFAFGQLPNSFELQSPENTFRLKVSIDKDGQAVYEVHRNDEAIVLPSPLGLSFESEKDGSPKFDKLIHSLAGITDTKWTPVWGEREEIHDHFRGALVSFIEGDATYAGRRLNIELRAYESGVAFRYLIDNQPIENPLNKLRLARERTEFRLPDDLPLWAVTSAQGKYQKLPLSKLKHPVERPCVLESDSGTVIAITEAALVDSARMRLRRSKAHPHTLIPALHRDKNSDPITFDVSTTSPWRVVMAADSASELLQNNDLIRNLNEPCQIDDTSWIKPGKVIRDVTLSTDGGRACVDFAVKYGLQFIEFDAGWYGDQGDEKSDARTVARRNLDLQNVLAYAKQHNIGVILYVNRRHLESQLDELLPLYKEWGVAGIKYGFVQHGSQKWTTWLHEAIEKSAKYKMMVDVHDEYRMTGWQRTYPNFMTAEGIGGDETRPTNEQALANLYTRMIAGAADHTFCYYAGHVDKVATHGSQLAKMVCFFSPWQFVFWYDQPKTANDEPELEFIKQLPTTWDDSLMLDGKIGEYAVVARRSDRSWFVGCLNAVKDRSINVPLDFLDDHQQYDAYIYTDDPNVATRTKVGIEERIVTSATVFKAELKNPGGIAIRIHPRKQ